MADVNQVKLPWQDWRIVRKIGQGSFGVVYEAERTLLGTVEKAAVKVISIPPDDDSYELMLLDSGYDETSVQKSIYEELQRVIKEYALMSRMRGISNIVSCDDFSYRKKESGNGYDVFIRMEMLRSLQEQIREKRSSEEYFTEEEVIKLGKDICKALMVCEKNDVIHRDVKPQNILISPQYGTYNLGDFGTARNLDHTTSATYAGSPSFMAPEVYKRQKYGKTVDIYSLGLVMYWLLNKYRRPFVPLEGEITSDIRIKAEDRRIAGEEMPAPCDASKEMSAVILKACAFNSEDRYNSAAEMLRDLERIERDSSAGVQIETQVRNGIFVGDDTDDLSNHDEEEKDPTDDAGEKTIGLFVDAGSDTNGSCNIDEGDKDPTDDIDEETYGSFVDAGSDTDVSSNHDEEDKDPTDDIGEKTIGMFVDTGSEEKEPDSEIVSDPPVHDERGVDIEDEKNDNDNTDTKKRRKKIVVICSIVLVLILFCVLGAVIYQVIYQKSTPTNFPIVVFDGFEYAVIREDDTLWMWGYNDYGQLGDGTTDDRHEPVKIMDDVKSVFLGRAFNTTSAAIKTDGTLWMWGDNDYGQLGDGTTDDRHEPVKIMDDVKSAFLGDTYTAAIKTDGTLWMWGTNHHGQLGDGTTEERHEPVKIMEDVQSVFLEGNSNATSAAIKTDGTLWMWGDNDYGQLGDGTTEERHEPVKIMDDVKSAFLGDTYTAAIKTDGTLWMWGRNRSGQLGDGTTEERHEPVKIMEDVQSVSLSFDHSAAIKTDGTLWMWGYNDYGQLGDGTTDDRHEPVKIMDDVQSVSLEHHYSAAIKTNGTLWMWGANSYGQLGDGTTDNRHKPEKIMGRVQMVGLGYTYGAAVKKDGSLWVWGRPREGDKTIHADPVRITFSDED